MDKTNDIRYAVHKVDGLLFKINNLIYKATMPDSDEGTFISDKEREEIEAEIKTLVKHAVDLLTEANTLPKTSPCSFCLYSKPLKNP